MKIKIYQIVTPILFLIIPSLSWADGYVHIFNNSSAQAIEIKSSASNGDFGSYKGSSSIIYPGQTSVFRASSPYPEATGYISIYYYNSGRTTYHCSTPYRYVYGQNMKVGPTNTGTCIVMQPGYITYNKINSNTVRVTVTIPYSIP